MNFEKIRRTTICFWSDEDQCFIAKSAISGSSMGMGDTQEEAMAAFEDALKRTKAAFEKDMLDSNTASGARDNRDDDPMLVSKILKLNRRTDRILFTLADKLGCNEDEAVDYLALFYEHARLIDGPQKANSSL